VSRKERNSFVAFISSISDVKTILLFHKAVGVDGRVQQYFIEFDLHHIFPFDLKRQHCVPNLAVIAK
jgi:hypothetical protein